MKIYLFLDQAEPIPNPLVSRIEGLTAGKIQVGSIHERRAMILLDRTVPILSRIAPYLVTVNRGRVHALTGRRLAWQLVYLLGPVRAWRIWNLMQSSSVRSAGEPRKGMGADCASDLGRLGV